MRKIFRPWLESVGFRIQIGLLSPSRAFSSHCRTSVMYSVGKMYDSGKKEKMAPWLDLIRRRLRSRLSFFVIPLVFGKWFTRCSWLAAVYSDGLKRPHFQ